MKILQGYASSSMKAFQFVEKHKLPQYNNIDEDMVVFGVYNKEDIDIISKHRGRVIVQWEGLDCKRYGNLEMFKHMDIINVSPHFRIVDYFKTIGVKCHEIKWITDRKPFAQVLGNKVYAYVNKNAKQYYGGDIIDGLRIEQEKLIADYTVPMDVWRKGLDIIYYSQAFISLQLSQFAGGGNSIVELGLRGVKVITNILRMPHCIPWENTVDIEKIINEEAKYIGCRNIELADKVFAELYDANNNEGYDLDKLIS